MQRARPEANLLRTPLLREEESIISYRQSTPRRKQHPRARVCRPRFLGPARRTSRAVKFSKEFVQGERQREPLEGLMEKRFDEKSPNSFGLARKLGRFTDFDHPSRRRGSWLPPLPGSCRPPRLYAARNLVCMRRPSPAWEEAASSAHRMMRFYNNKRKVNNL